MSDQSDVLLSEENEISDMEQHDSDVTHDPALEERNNVVLKSVGKGTVAAESSSTEYESTIEDDERLVECLKSTSSNNARKQENNLKNYQQCRRVDPVLMKKTEEKKRDPLLGAKCMNCRIIINPYTIFKCFDCSVKNPYLCQNCFVSRARLDCYRSNHKFCMIDPVGPNIFKEEEGEVSFSLVQVVSLFKLLKCCKDPEDWVRKNIVFPGMTHADAIEHFKKFLTSPLANLLHDEDFATSAIQPVTDDNIEMFTPDFTSDDLLKILSNRHTKSFLTDFFDAGKRLLKTNAQCYQELECSNQKEVQKNSKVNHVLNGNRKFEADAVSDVAVDTFIEDVIDKVEQQAIKGESKMCFFTQLKQEKHVPSTVGYFIDLTEQYWAERVLRFIQQSRGNRIRGVRMCINKLLGTVVYGPPCHKSTRQYVFPEKFDWKDYIHANFERNKTCANEMVSPTLKKNQEKIFENNSVHSKKLEEASTSNQRDFSLLKASLCTTENKSSRKRPAVHDSSQPSSEREMSFEKEPSSEMEISGDLMVLSPEIEDVVEKSSSIDKDASIEKDAPSESHSTHEKSSFSEKELSPEIDLSAEPESSDGLSSDAESSFDETSSVESEIPEPPGTPKVIFNKDGSARKIREKAIVWSWLINGKRVDRLPETDETPASSNDTGEKPNELSRGPQYVNPFALMPPNSGNDYIDNIKGMNCFIPSVNVLSSVPSVQTKVSEVDCDFSYVPTKKRAIDGSLTQKPIISSWFTSTQRRIPRLQIDNNLFHTTETKACAISTQLPSVPSLKTTQPLTFQSLPTSSGMLTDTVEPSSSMSVPLPNQSCDLTQQMTAAASSRMLTEPVESSRSMSVQLASRFCDSIEQNTAATTSLQTQQSSSPQSLTQSRSNGASPFSTTPTSAQHVTSEPVLDYSRVPKKKRAVVREPSENQKSVSPNHDSLQPLKPQHSCCYETKERNTFSNVTVDPSSWFFSNDIVEKIEEINKIYNTDFCEKCFDISELPPTFPHEEFLQTAEWSDKMKDKVEDAHFSFSKIPFNNYQSPYQSNIRKRLAIKAVLSKETATASKLRTPLEKLEITKKRTAKIKDLEMSALPSKPTNESEADNSDDDNNSLIFDSSDSEVKKLQDKLSTILLKQKMVKSCVMAYEVAKLPMRPQKHKKMDEAVKRKRFRIHSRKIKLPFKDNDTNLFESLGFRRRCKSDSYHMENFAKVKHEVGHIYEGDRATSDMEPETSEPNDATFEIKRTSYADCVEYVRKNQHVPAYYSYPQKVLKKLKLNYCPMRSDSKKRYRIFTTPGTENVSVQFQKDGDKIYVTIEDKIPESEKVPELPERQNSLFPSAMENKFGKIPRDQINYTMMNNIRQSERTQKIEKTADCHYLDLNTTPYFVTFSPETNCVELEEADIAYQDVNKCDDYNSKNAPIFDMINEFIGLPPSAIFDSTIDENYQVLDKHNRDYDSTTSVPILEAGGQECDVVIKKSVVTTNSKVTAMQQKEALKYHMNLGFIQTPVSELDRHLKKSNLSRKYDKAELGFYQVYKPQDMKKDKKLKKSPNLDSLQDEYSAINYNVYRDDFEVENQNEAESLLINHCQRVDPAGESEFMDTCRVHAYTRVVANRRAQTIMAKENNMIPTFLEISKKTLNPLGIHPHIESLIKGTILERRKKKYMKLLIIIQAICSKEHLTDYVESMIEYEKLRTRVAVLEKLLVQKTT